MVLLVLLVVVLRMNLLLLLILVGASSCRRLRATAAERDARADASELREALDAVHRVRHCRYSVGCNNDDGIDEVKQDVDYFF